MVNADEILEHLNRHHEWLLVRETGKTFPLNRTEIEIDSEADKTLFGFLDDKGFHSWRLNEALLSEDEISLDVAGAFGQKRETIKLIHRIAGSELTAVIGLSFPVPRLKVSAADAVAPEQRAAPVCRLFDADVLAIGLVEA